MFLLLGKDRLTFTNSHFVYKTGLLGLLTLFLLGLPAAAVGMGSGTSNDDGIGCILPPDGSLSDANDLLSGMVRDTKGNIYLVGSFEGKVQVGDTVLESAGNYDLFVAKFDSENELIWVRVMGGQGSDRGFALALDEWEQVIITGWFADDFHIEGQTLSSEGYSDVFLAKFDGDGSLLWAKQLGGSGEDRVTAFYLEEGKIGLEGHFTHHHSFGLAYLKQKESRRFTVQYDAGGELEWFELGAK